MTKTPGTKPTAAPGTSAPKPKNRQVMDLLSRDDGATLKEMSRAACWLPHSTRSFMTGLKKKSYVIESDRSMVFVVTASVRVEANSGPRR